MTKKLSIAQTRIQKQKEQMIEQLKKNPIIQIACEKLEIGRATHYRWSTEDAEYAKSVDLAVQEGVIFFAEFSESKLHNAVRNDQPWAIAMSLKALHPRYKNKLEISGSIQHNTRELTPEDEALLKESLRLALPTNHIEQHGDNTQS